MRLELKVYSLPIERNTSHLHESLIHPESSQSLSVVVIVVVVIPLTLQRDNVSSLFSILDENVPTEFTQEELNEKLKHKKEMSKEKKFQEEMVFIYHVIIILM
jgi:hypothetical protein